jgi:hypothetical protein
VSGADPIDTRPGFAAMLKRIEGNGVKSIIVETATRFARDLTVQLTGHDYLNPVQPDSGPPALPNCAKDSVRHPRTKRAPFSGPIYYDNRGIV